MNGAPGRRGSALAPGRPCPLCGLRRATTRAGGKASLPAPGPVRCAGCGLVFVDPLPLAALSHSTYGHDYYEPWQGEEELLRIALWRRRLARVAAHAPVSSLLDIGCGDGLFLAVARQAGWLVEGIEFSPEGARRASVRLGRPVAVGDLSRDRLLAGPFDVVTLWHVLEHLADPAAMLAAARQRLRAGGLLAVAVPNLRNLPMQAAYLLARRRRLPLYEAGAREPHLSHFSEPTLTRILERAGFASIRIEADRCALTRAKRAIDAVASWLSRLSGRLMTDAIVAFARCPE
jgi:SAM-dependent methyltransferase